MEDLRMVVNIRNYQRIKKAGFVFEPGLNVIVGPSNNGKSSSIRAITSAIFNLSRDSHVTVGETVSAVGIRYRGHEVVWKRDLNQASKNSYRIDGKVFTKLGKGQPKEVADALGISEIDLDDVRERLNFQKQMAYPFLLDRTPSQVFKFMAQSAEEDNLMAIIDQMKTDWNSIQVEIKANQAAMDSIRVAFNREKILYEKIKGKAKVCQIVIQMDALVKKFLSLENGLDAVYENESAVETAELELDRVQQDLPLVEKVLEEAAPSYNVVMELSGELVKLQSLQREIDSQNGVVESLSTRLGVLEGLPSAELFQDMAQIWAMYVKVKEAHESKFAHKKEIAYLRSKLDSTESKMGRASELCDEIDSLEGWISNIKFVLSQRDSFSTEVEEVSSSLSEVLSELQEFEVCPYCGSSLKEGNHGEC